MFIDIEDIQLLISQRVLLACCNFSSSLLFFNAKLMIFATSSKVFSSNPRVVAAGVPKRIPLVTKGFS